MKILRILGLSLLCISSSIFAATSNQTDISVDVASSTIISGLSNPISLKDVSPQTILSGDVQPDIDNVLMYQNNGNGLDVTITSQYTDTNNDPILESSTTTSQIPFTLTCTQLCDGGPLTAFSPKDSPVYIPEQYSTYDACTTAEGGSPATCHFEFGPMTALPESGTYQGYLRLVVAPKP